MILWAIFNTIRTSCYENEIIIFILKKFFIIFVISVSKFTENWAMAVDDFAEHFY